MATEFSNEPLYIPDTLDWKNVLNYHHLPCFWGCLDDFRQLAKEIGYPYILWGDRVYVVSVGKQTATILHDGVLKYE